MKIDKKKTKNGGWLWVCEVFKDLSAKIISLKIGLFSSRDVS